MPLDHYQEVRQVFLRFPKFGFDTSDVHLFLPYEAQEVISRDAIRRQVRKLLSNGEIEPFPKRGKGKYKRKPQVVVNTPAPEPAEAASVPEPVVESKAPHLPVATPERLLPPLASTPPPPPVTLETPPPPPEEPVKVDLTPKPDDHFLSWLHGKSFDRGPGRP